MLMLQQDICRVRGASAAHAAERRALCRRCAQARRAHDADDLRARASARAAFCPRLRRRARRAPRLMIFRFTARRRR